MSFVVTRQEQQLLTLARVAVGIIPPTDAMRLLVGPHLAPVKLGPTARAALSDTLSRGVALSFAQQGGWLSEGGQRLWERAALPKLEFTGNTVRLLSWLLAAPLIEAEGPPLLFSGELTPAEDFVVALVIDRLRGTGCAEMLTRQPALRSLPLTVLAHAGELALPFPLEAAPAFEFPLHAPWLEGLRLLLARSWLGVERLRPSLTLPEQLIRVGQAQELVLDAFLRQVDAAGRRELATFLVDAATRWLTPTREADESVLGMQLDGPLRERTEARRRSAALLRALQRLREWDRGHRAVRFIDEGYEQAQRLVSDWERLGERGFTRAAELIARFDAIPTLAPVEPTPPPEKST